MKMYFNGEIVEEKDAKVSVFDAGYYFGDGIYEVILLQHGKLIDKELHLNRLEECLKKVHFKNVPTKEEVLNNINELIKINQIENASIYIQISRGSAVRTHTFANLNLKPNVMIRMDEFKVARELKQWNCKLIDDPRRLRCDIKMISLMPMVLAKYESEVEGYDDIIYYNPRVNSITESSSANVFIVKDGKFITSPLGNEILPGCTRHRVIELCKQAGKVVEERYYTKEELENADEVFVTGSIKIIVSVVKVDGKNIADGKVGTNTQWIFDEFIKFIDEHK